MLVSLIAFTVALIVMPPVLHVLRRIRAMDVPNDRSSHSTPILRGGGIAVLLGVVAASLVSDDAWYWSLLVVVVALGCVGFIDDLRGLSGPVRLAAQVAAGSALGWWALSQDAGGSSGLDILVFVGVCVGVAGYVNAFNFMDGINGISGINAVVAGGWFAWVGREYSVPALTALALSVAGASLGFLPWNFPAAKVFLGDVGSYALGALLSGMAVVAWVNQVPILVCVAPLVLYAVDTGWVLVKRAAGGRPLMQAHREHVYQRLVDRGWSHPTTAMVTGAGAALCCLATRAEPPIAVGIVALLMLVYLLMPSIARSLQGAEAGT